MKTALLFSGKLGEWKECSKSIQKNIISPLDSDIFCSLWENEDYLDFIKLYKPKDFRALDLSDTIKYLRPENLKRKPNPSLIPMLAGMKAVHTIFSNYSLRTKTNYDLIIRIRPDIQVLEQIKENEIKDCLKNKNIRLPFFESSNIYDHEKELNKKLSFNFIYEKASLPNQVNDQLAIGHPYQMNKYMNSLMSVSTAINSMIEEGYPDYMTKVPESILTMCLKMQQCKYKQLTGTSSFGNIKTILCK